MDQGLCIPPPHIPGAKLATLVHVVMGIILAGGLEVRPDPGG